MWKTANCLPSYAEKTIFGLFGTNWQTRFQFPCETKLSKTSFCQVLIIKFWLKWGVFCENLLSGCQIRPGKPLPAHLPQICMLDPSPYTYPQNPSVRENTQNNVSILFSTSSVKEHINTSLNISESMMEYLLKKCKLRYCFQAKQ